MANPFQKSFIYTLQSFLKQNKKIKMRYTHRSSITILNGEIIRDIRYTNNIDFIDKETWYW